MGNMIDEILDKYYSRKLGKIISNHIYYTYIGFDTKCKINKDKIIIYIKEEKEKDEYYKILYSSSIFYSFTKLIRINKVINEIDKKIKIMYY